jgi:hypothetical protein
MQQTSSILTQSNSIPMDQNTQPPEVKAGDQPKAKVENLTSARLKVSLFDNPATQKVPIAEIAGPVAFIRLDHDDNFADLANVESLDPVTVISMEGIPGFVLLEGQRRLQYLKKEGATEITVMVVGSATYASQAGMARAVEMTKFKKSMTALELSLGIYRLSQLITEDFGPEHFFVHGGDRKNGNASKESLPGFIAKSLGLKQSTVGALLNFAEELGPEALEGLQNHEGMPEFSIKKINQVNARLKGEKLADRIKEQLNDLENAGASDAEKSVVAAQIAHQAISKGQTDESDPPIKSKSKADKSQQKRKQKPGIEGASQQQKDPVGKKGENSEDNQGNPIYDPSEVIRQFSLMDSSSLNLKEQLLSDGGWSKERVKELTASRALFDKQLMEFTGFLDDIIDDIIDEIDS